MSIWDKLKESIVIGTVVAAPTVSSQQVKASVVDKKQEAKDMCFLRKMISATKL